MNGEFSADNNHLAIGIEGNGCWWKWYWKPTPEKIAVLTPMFSQFHGDGRAVEEIAEKLQKGDDLFGEFSNLFPILDLEVEK